MLAFFAPFAIAIKHNIVQKRLVDVCWCDKSQVANLLCRHFLLNSGAVALVCPQKAAPTFSRCGRWCAVGLKMQPRKKQPLGLRKISTKGYAHWWHGGLMSKLMPWGPHGPHCLNRIVTLVWVLEFRYLWVVKPVCSGCSLCISRAYSEGSFEVLICFNTSCNTVATYLAWGLARCFLTWQACTG